MKREDESTARVNDSGMNWSRRCMSSGTLQEFKWHRQGSEVERIKAPQGHMLILEIKIQDMKRHSSDLESPQRVRSQRRRQLAGSFWKRQE